MILSLSPSEGIPARGSCPSGQAQVRQVRDMQKQHSPLPQLFIKVMSSGDTQATAHSREIFIVVGGCGVVGV